MILEYNIISSVKGKKTHTANNKLKQEELPSHLLIISDMEFDRGVYSKNGTNIDGWKQTFELNEYELSIIYSGMSLVRYKEHLQPDLIMIWQ